MDMDYEIAVGLDFSGELDFADMLPVLNDTEKNCMWVVCLFIYLLDDAKVPNPLIINAASKEAHGVKGWIDWVFSLILGHIGLVNPSILCYAIVVVQSLFLVPEFRNGLYNWVDLYVFFTTSLILRSSPNPIASELKRLFVKLQSLGEPVRIRVCSCHNLELILSLLPAWWMRCTTSTLMNSKTPKNLWKHCWIRARCKISQRRYLSGRLKVCFSDRELTKVLTPRDTDLWDLFLEINLSC